jgi:hypothetical protein
MSRRVARLQKRAKLAITSGGEAPPCGGTEHTIGTGTTLIDGWIDEIDYEQKYSPGDTLLITSGNRDRLTIRNVHGTAECWITIRNEGGAVVFTSTTQSGIQLENCQYVHVDGGGDLPTTEYGFQATASLIGDQAVFIGFRSIHIRMNNVDAANSTAAGFMIHTINDAGRDYGLDPIGTPSTWSGPNAWLDQDYTFYHCRSLSNGGSAYYLGNNHAQRDGVPDCKNLTIYDCIANDCEGGFNFKTQTNLLAYDLTAEGNGRNLNPSFQYNFNLGAGSSGVLRDSTGTNVAGNVLFGLVCANAFRPVEVYNMTISGSNKRSININHTSVEEDDGGTVDIHDNNLTSPNEDGIRFDVSNVAAAAGSRIVDNIIEFNAADDCIDVRDLAVGTEAGNTCTPI